MLDVDKLKDEEVKKYQLQAVVIKKQSKQIKEKLQEHFDFEIVDYLIDDILENETYQHFCSLVGLAVENDRLNVDDGETLKEGIKDIFEITSDYDKLDKSVLIDTSDDEQMYNDYYIKELIDINKYFDKADKLLLKKLSITFKNKVLTNFEFDSLRADLAEYSFAGDENTKGMDLKFCKKLEDTDVSEEEYIALVNKVDSISRDYGIF